MATPSGGSHATRRPVGRPRGIAAGALSDLGEIVGGLPDEPIDAWDAEHIRRTLPWLRTFVRTYFRGEVRPLRA